MELNLRTGWGYGTRVSFAHGENNGKFQLIIEQATVPDHPIAEHPQVCGHVKLISDDRKSFENMLDKIMVAITNYMSHRDEASFEDGNFRYMACKVCNPVEMIKHG